MKATHFTSSQIKDLESQVFERVLALLPTDFFLVGVTLEKNAGHWALQIFVDKPDVRISLQDCETLSRHLDAEIDALKLPLEAFSLEVSSPGLFRPLKTPREFEFYRHREIRIDNGSGQKHLLGELVGHSECAIELKLPGGRLEAVVLTEQTVVTLNPKIEDSPHD